MMMKIMAIQANRLNLLDSPALSATASATACVSATCHVAIVAKWQQSQANKNEARLFAMCTNTPTPVSASHTACKSFWVRNF